MVAILLSVLVVECVALLFWGMHKKGRIYEFPFLASAVFTGLLLPQLIGLTNDYTLPTGSLEKTLVMSILCMAMCYLGYTWSSKPFKSLSWQLAPQRLLFGGVVLTVVGAYFFLALNRLAEDLLNETQWSGQTVRYYFFALLLPFGFCISCFLYVRTTSRAALASAVFGSLFLLDRILVGGRRAIAAQFCLMVLCALWFNRRWSVPRGLMLFVLAASSLICYSIGQYRAAVQAGSAYHSVFRALPSVKAKDLKRLQLLENFQLVLSAGQHDVRAAAFDIAATDETGRFDFGLWHWNRLVFSFFPGQLFGRVVKESLMVPLADNAWEVFGYENPVGACRTGLSDAFRSFWYFGCLKFFLIALVLRRLFETATRGSFAAGVVYACILHSSLLAIAQDTGFIVSSCVMVAVFLLPFLYWAALPARPAWTGAYVSQSTP